MVDSVEATTDMRGRPLVFVTVSSCYEYAIRKDDGTFTPVYYLSKGVRMFSPYRSFAEEGTDIGIAKSEVMVSKRILGLIPLQRKVQIEYHLKE